MTKITAPSLIRWAGLSAMAAGIIFGVTQPIHPPDILSSVSTPRCAIVHIFSTAMCFLAPLDNAGTEGGAGVVGGCRWACPRGYEPPSPRYDISGSRAPVYPRPA